jgi:hypothetical protein
MFQTPGKASANHRRFPLSGRLGFEGPAGVPTGDPGRLIYFSFETLTTVSYGDAYPVHRIARSLTTAEALIGQLYPRS